MTHRILPTVLLLALLLAGCGREAAVAPNGKYLLAERPTEVDAPNAIEFRPDGSCLVDAGERTGIAGKYHVNRDGTLKIEADTGTKTEYTYHYQLLKYTLVLSQDEDTTLYYVRLPDGPHPRYDEIVGIFQAHNDLGDSAGELAADYTFRSHLLNLPPGEHTYYDISMDGKCTYADGVVTYIPEHSNAPQQDKYLRDFIVKRDAKGLWVIDPFHDAVLCETPATSLDLPPPPKGYRDGSQR